MQLGEKLAGLFLGKKCKEEKQETFCILPWIHVDCLADSAVARICCSSNPVEENHVPLSYYHHSVDDICNSAYMRDVRRRMIAGERVAACNICYVNESNNIKSRRIMQNNEWRRCAGLDYEEIVRETIRNDYRINVSPYFIQLNLGNLCNLKCRMCHAGNSTVISKDPVQSLWSPPRYPNKRLFWQGNKISLLPQLFIGCRYEGFADLIFYNKKGFVSVSDTGKVIMPVFRGTPLERLELGLVSGQDIDNIVIACNGRMLGEISLGKDVRKDVVYDLSAFTGNSQIEIAVTLPADRGGKAVQVYRLDIYKTNDKRSDGETEIGYCRTGSKSPWYLQEGIIFGDFLKDISRVRKILFTGGEPLLNPVMEKIIDFLISHHMESSIDITLNTNSTYIPNSVLNKLCRFKNLHLNLSVDAVGNVYEYIRFPAKWERVRANILALKEMNMSLVAVPILQAYNVLYVADLCRFFEDVGIRYNLLMMHGPYFLHCGLLPAPVRKIAADRLRAYANDEAPDDKKDSLLNIANSIENLSIKSDRQQEALKHFMMFTNDMDRVNSQNIHSSLPELVALLQEYGAPWNDTTRYARYGSEGGPKATAAVSLPDTPV